MPRQRSPCPSMKAYSAYYKGQRIEFDLPKTWKVLAVAEPRETKPIQDVPRQLRDTLERPLGTSSLRELASGARSVAIISDDQTRPTPVHILLPTVLDELNSAGVPDSRISVIIGRGTHRPPNEEECAKKLGEHSVRRVSVKVHDPDDANGLRYLGVSSRGTPVWINNLVVDADFRIGIGNVAPHYFAGYGGGPKIILPGVSGRETIVRNHVLITDSNTVQGRIDGNPIYSDMLEIARMAHLDMKIDVLLDMENRITSIVAGDVTSAHRKGIEEVDKIYGIRPPAMADVVITSGYPLEENLIQSNKATLSAGLMTKDGGTIILLSGCYDGPGPKLYETLSERPEPEEVVRWIAEGKAGPSGGPSAGRIRQMLKTKKIVVVTDGISKKMLDDMELNSSASIQDAIAETCREKERADVIIMPAGGSMNPITSSVNS